MQRPHPVGLPVSVTASPSVQAVMTWQYLTLDLAQLGGFPATACSRLHLVSPPRSHRWTLLCTIAPQSLSTQAELHASEREEPALIRRLEQQARQAQDEGRGELLLLPSDDRLLSRNRHTQGTQDVFGDVGGPPLGLQAPPCCPLCHKRMFHMCTVASTIRAYGDGFRSLLFCEPCRQVASVGTGWSELLLFFLRGERACRRAASRAQQEACTRRRRDQRRVPCLPRVLCLREKYTLRSDNPDQRADAAREVGGCLARSMLTCSRLTWHARPAPPRSLQMGPPAAPP